MNNIDTIKVFEGLEQLRDECLQAYFGTGDVHELYKEVVSKIEHGIPAGLPYNHIAEHSLRTTHDELKKCGPSKDCMLAAYDGLNAALIELTA